MSVVIGNYFQEALNFETVIATLGQSETTLDPMFDELARQVDVSVPLVECVSEYGKFLGVPLKKLLETYQKVALSFRKLSHSDRVLKRGTPDYPLNVQQDSFTPRFLYVRGNHELLCHTIVSITGTRPPSGEAKRTAKETVTMLKDTGYAIASGLSMGIDGIAHLTCLAEQVDAIAVLATSLADAYPVQHIALQEKIAEKGLLITRFSPSAIAQKWYFPLRSRLMSSLAAVTMVIEDRDGGAAVRQAEYALEQGRHVLLYNHTVENRMLQWPRRLAIRPGVMIVKQPSQIVKTLRNVLEKGNDQEKVMQTMGQLTLF